MISVHRDDFRARSVPLKIHNIVYFFFNKLGTLLVIMFYPSRYNLQDF